MKRKRKSQFETDEEYRVWRAQSDENLRRLRGRIELIEAELAARGEPRGLEYWIERHKAERASREQPQS
jgi:hypothetical protein